MLNLWKLQGSLLTFESYTAPQEELCGEAKLN